MAIGPTKRVAAKADTVIFNEARAGDTVVRRVLDAVGRARPTWIKNTRPCPIGRPRPVHWGVAPVVVGGHRARVPTRVRLSHRYPPTRHRCIGNEMQLSAQVHRYDLLRCTGVSRSGGTRPSTRGQLLNNFFSVFTLDPSGSSPKTITTRTDRESSLKKKKLFSTVVDRFTERIDHVFGDHRIYPKKLCTSAFLFCTYTEMFLGHTAIVHFDNSMGPAKLDPIINMVVAVAL